MNSLRLVNYFEKQAKVSSRLRELMAKAAQYLLRKDEKRNFGAALFQEGLTATMDVYELEGILEQLKLRYQQKCSTQELMHTTYKHSIELCVQVRNLDWKAQLHCKLELLQLQCENEMRELSEEYEAERQRRSVLEQRPMVQKARMVEDEVRNMQAKIEDGRERVAAEQAILFEQLKELENERNAIIVYLVETSKQVPDLETELETMKDTDKRMKELVTQKQELLAKLHGKLRDSTSLSDVELSPEQPQSTTTKLEALPSLGNVNNAIVCNKRKEISFIELFKEWETERQLQFQQLSLVENASIIMDKMCTSLEANELSVADNDISNITPRSILRRPSITEDGDNSAVIPKKRVRFATPEMETKEDAFMSSTTPRAIEGVNCADEGERENQNHTFVIEQNNSLLNGATETIEIFSTGEIEEAEQMRKEELTKQTPKKSEFTKATKLVKKARLFGSQRLNKTQKIKTTAGEKQKIEIQECRIVKPAGTKLPTKLPLTLTPEPEPQAPPANPPISSAATLPVTTNQTFKVSLKPTKRKSRKMPDCKTFFREYLEQSHEENLQKSTGIDYRAEAGVNDPIITAEPLQASAKYTPKRKKIDMNIDAFGYEPLMSPNERCDAAENDDFLQFDMKFKFDENQGLLGDSVDDFFGGQVNRDDDMLSFDFSDENVEENSKMDMFF
ncbi:uncharacterized protein LOC128864601 [Anastrepha ludens]|uniref:uncharacterized protein LOC128864601 n=1 Tax=Anastrepha ludens TaxID=28586 RepID=UPI0023AEFF8E|nr:uncharacterized protein LOC128864601 [Anastrepha ludens]